MSYIDKINAFERWLEHNHLPALSQLLWYKFIMVHNRAGWAQWVCVDNLRLIAMVSGAGTEKTVLLARQKLIDAGLLTYRKGKKGSPNKYCLLYEPLFTVKSAVYSTVKATAQPTDIKDKEQYEDSSPQPPKGGRTLRKRKALQGWKISEEEEQAMEDIFRCGDV